MGLLMLKKLVTIFVLVFVGNLSALSTHVLNTAFVLLQEDAVDHRDKTKELLSAFFSENTGEVSFIIEEFINWASDETDKITHWLDEAAFYATCEERELAINVIKNYYGSDKPEVIEFATTFVDWGIELVKMQRILDRESQG